MLNPFSNRKVLKRGYRATAKIVEMTAPSHGSQPSKVSMTLEIEHGESRYEVSDRWMVSGTEPIGPGSELSVAVDPDNRGRVAIDWERTRAAYRQRTDKRRQMLSVGVPVPVSKVREAAAEIGYVPLSSPHREPRPSEDESRHERELLAQAGEAPAAPMPASSPPAPPAAVPIVHRPEGQEDADVEDLTAKLERLAALHSAGALTEGEFDAAKRQVLSLG